MSRGVNVVIIVAALLLAIAVISLVFLAVGNG